MFFVNSIIPKGVRALPSDEEALEVLKAGFGDTWEFDGKGYLTSPGVSRKSVVVPVITEVLNQCPHE